MKSKTCAALFTLALVTSANAGTIDFESPTYALGEFVAFGPNGGPAPFNEQGGWSSSASNARGIITNTLSSGLYVGGQAFTVGNANVTYIGANNVVGWDGGTTLTFDLQQNTRDRITVGMWADGANVGPLDGNFSNAEMGFGAGTISGSGQFGFRATGTGGQFGTEFGSGVAPTLGNWYRVTVTYDDAAFTSTLSVFDLTTSTLLDLNGATAGTAFSHTFVSGWPAGNNGYGLLTSEATGFTVRLSNANNLIDNIVTIPEPSTMALALVGALSLIARQRSRGRH